MKKNTKKFRGFTLIELLSVIVILSVIAVIILPLIGNVIEESRKKAFINSVYNAMSAIRENISSDDFSAFPMEGILAKTEIPSLEKNPFISGKFKTYGKELTAVQVTDGRYCAAGTKEKLRVVLGECYLIDETVPIASLKISQITSNSIQIIMDAYDDESDIIGYQFSKDGGKTYTSMQKTNTYTFSKLKKNTKFSMRAKVINKKELVSESQIIEVTTLDFSAPTFTSSPALTTWSRSKEITIHYPTTVSGLTYEYSIDKGLNWTQSSSSQQKLTVKTNNLTIMARVKDGYDPNTAVSTALTITTIDDGIPTDVKLEYVSATTTSIKVKASAKASTMGIKGYYFSSDDGENWSDIQESTDYNYTGLSINTTYPLRVRVLGNNGESAEGTLKAQTLNQYTVTFNGNGATVSPATKDVNAGSQIGTLPSPTKTNYTLQGWYTELGGGNKIDTTQIINNPTTYYARWYRNTVSKSGTNNYNFTMSVSVKQTGINSVALSVTMSNNKRSACGTGSFSYSCGGEGETNNSFEYKFGISGSCAYIYDGAWAVPMKSVTVNKIGKGATINCTATFKSNNSGFFGNDISVTTPAFTMGT